MSRFEEIVIKDGDGTTLADVATNTDRDTDLDGLNGLVTNAMMFGRVSDTVVKNSRLDASTEALMTVSYAHHEVHAGSHYTHRASHALAANDVYDHLIITPDTTKWAHMIIGVLAVTSSVEVTLYEDATVSANGTVENVRNRNRNVADGNTTEVYTAPTVTGVGNVIAQGTVGAGKGSSGGGTRDAEEMILKQNTIYLLRVEEVASPAAATVVNFDISWYEHQDRN